MMKARLSGPTIPADLTQVPTPHPAPQSLRACIASCLASDPTQRPTFEMLVEALRQQVIPDCEVAFYEARIRKIPDVNGQNFWRSYFFRREKVQWSTFHDCFIPLREYDRQCAAQDDESPESGLLPNMPTEEQLNDATMEQLEELRNRNRMGREVVRRVLRQRQQIGYITETVREEDQWLQRVLCPEDDYVTMKSFKEMIAWFGPLDGAFEQRLRDVMASPYFHGRLSFDESTTLIKRRLKQQRGESPCVVRFSSSKAGAFVICFLARKDDGSSRILHHTVPYKMGHGFHFEGQFYPSFPTLMNAAKAHFRFTVCCPGSPFQLM